MLYTVIGNVASTAIVKKMYEMSSKLKNRTPNMIQRIPSGVSIENETVIQEIYAPLSSLDHYLQ